MLNAFRLNAVFAPAATGWRGGVAPLATKTTARVDDAEMDDREIIERVLAGERDLFERLVVTHERGVFLHVKRLVANQEEAEDLTQEAFVRAFIRLDTYQPTFAFRTWLYRIAANLAFSSLRARRPAMSLDEPMAVTGESSGSSGDSVGLIREHADPDAVSPIDRIDQRQTRQRLDDAIAVLSPKARAVVDLRYREEMDLGEIAEALETTANDIAVTLHRARLRLRDILQADGKG